MFSTGQLVFAILFLIVFTFVIVFSYRKDKNVHRKFYKKNIWVFVIFVVFILLLIGLNTFLNE